MAKQKETDLVEEIREEEPLETKGPLRDEPAPAYSPAWEVVNDRQNILADKIPPKIFSIEALIAAGVVNEENLAAYLADNGYVTFSNYATSSKSGVIKTSTSNGSLVNNGIILASLLTLEQYNAAGQFAFIGKGTLENIKNELLVSTLVSICDSDGSAAEGTQWSAFKLVKGEAGYVLSYTTTTPTP